MFLNKSENQDRLTTTKISPIIKKKISNIIVKSIFIEENEQDILDCLDNIWNLKSQPSIYDEENSYWDLRRYYLLSSNMDLDYVLNEYLNISSCSDEVFINFIEHIFYPNYYAVKYEHIQEYDFFKKINEYLERCKFTLHPIGEINDFPIFKILPLDVTNDNMINSFGIIFAAQSKPDFQVHNINTNIEDISIDISDPSKYLVYDEGNQKNLITWNELNSWYIKIRNRYPFHRITSTLKEQCENSLSNPFERDFFKYYFELYEEKLNTKLPALFPQVHLNVDTKNKNKENKINQRMDFMLCLNNGKRIIIELDGYEHYAEKIYHPNGTYNYKFAPKNYANMVTVDRKLRLDGYDIYRFGGSEYAKNPMDFKNIMKEFFDALFEKYSIISF